MGRKFWILTPLLLLSTSILFFPQLASTFVGKKIVVQMAEAKTGMTIKMETLNLTWFGPQRFQSVTFQNSEANGSFDELLAQMPLWKLSKLKGEFTLTNGKFSLKLANAKLENVSVKIVDQQFFAAGSCSQDQVQGSFNIEGTVEKFPSNFSLQGRLTSFPSLILDDLLKAKGLIVDAFGPSFNLEGSANTGSLDLKLSSPNCKTEVHGNFDGKTLKLRDPLSATFKLTPALSALLTRDINPLFLTAVQSKDPIRLTISPDDFSLPYAPFNEKNLSIPKGRIEIGRVVCQNGPTLNTLIALLQSKWLKKTDQMNAWFAPLDFRIQNGFLETGRLDLLLADSIHVCTWGYIDLRRDQINMYLGLPADTLEKSFGIKGLNSNYVLKIPIRGTTKKPELETGPATAQITAMAAAQKIPLPGKVGKIFGTVVNTVTGLKNDPDVPPAQRPFPWETSR